MQYEMNLNKKPFDMINSGIKTIELRLNDEKRQRLKKGDEIVFTNIETEEKLKVRIINIYHFNNFDELYANLPLLKCGYTKDTIKNADSKDMNFYYNDEEQSKYGVIGIEITKMI